MSRAAVIVLCLLACLALPVAASAVGPTPTLVNQRADRLALSAYETYLQALILSRPSTKTAELTFAASTASTCKGALATIASMSSAPSGSSAALLSIGQEIGDDANLEFILSGAASPFTHLSTSLSALHWAGANPSNTVKRFVLAENAMLALQPSALCADAYWVASKVSSPPITTSPQTTTFLGTYEADSTMANTRLTALLKLLDNYETAGDKGLVSKINLLAKQVNTLNTNVVKLGTDALFVALGVPKASVARAAAA